MVDGTSHHCSLTANSPSSTMGTDLHLSGGDLWTASQILFEGVQQRCLWLASAGLAACNHSTPSLVPWSWVRRLANPDTARNVQRLPCHGDMPPLISANRSGSGTWVGCFSHAASSETTLVCHHPSDHQYGAKRPSPGADRMANSSSGTWRFICTMRSAPCAIFEVISRTAASSPWLNASCNSTRRSSIH